MTDFMLAFCSVVDGILIFCLLFLFLRLDGEIDELRSAMSEANLKQGFEIADLKRSIAEMRGGRIHALADTPRRRRND